MQDRKVSIDTVCVAKGSVILTSEPDYFVNFFDLDTDYDVITSKLCKFDELKADGTMQALADKYSLTLAD